MTEERLQKFLASSGVASRRHSETLIRQGRISVNDEPATLGMKVDPETDTIRVDGVEVGPQAKRYVMLNKPAGVITTADDPQGRPTVVDLVDIDERVVPVGRLDADTTGLLLLSNDGELAHRLTHPSFGVTKIYRALVQGSIPNTAISSLAKGVELEDGMTAPAEVRCMQRSKDKSLVELAIHEGRNRQVRRMLDAVGHPVLDLVRVRFGPLALGDLAPGATRDLNAKEIRQLRKAVGLARPRHDRD
jgi:23S rRNA pseudouridine2605 synthase